MLYNKYVINVIFLFILSFCSSAVCQNQEQAIRMENYYKFDNLFVELQMDSSLKKQDIEYRNYPHHFLDTCFYSFVNRIPFFYPYATFKMVKPNGTLFCILHDCPAEMTDLRVVEFVTYDKNGVLKNRMMLPYEKSGWFSPNPEDFFRLGIYTSEKQLLFLQTIYTKKNGYSEEPRIIYWINDEAIPIMNNQTH